MTQRSALTTRDDFDMWVFHMDDALVEFLDSLPPEVSGRLDYSPESLDVLEAWLLEHYAGPQPLMAETGVWDGAARYVGETLRKQAGGHWTIDLEDPKNAFYGLPVLTGFRAPTSPMSLVTAATHRRTGRYLRTVLDNSRAQP